jgi:hypothetical protein
MKPGNHLIVSVFMGTAVWFFMKSLYAGLVCFFTGTLLDIDHLLDYIIHYGYRGFTYSKFRLACEQINFKKIYIIFHSTEVAILLWMFAVFTQNLYLLSGALGYSVHLFLDHIGNPLYFRSYVTIWRIMNNFNAAKMIRRNFIHKETPTCCQ